eukprot:5904682-Lingulodinium_polyedra.AAC.1
MNAGMAAQAKVMILRRLQYDWVRGRSRRGASAAASTDVGPGAVSTTVPAGSQSYVTAIVAAMEA